MLIHVAMIREESGRRVSDRKVHVMYVCMYVCMCVCSGGITCGASGCVEVAQDGWIDGCIVEWMRCRFNLSIEVVTSLYRRTYIPTYKETILIVLTPESGHPYRMR